MKKTMRRLIKLFTVLVILQSTGCLGIAEQKNISRGIAFLNWFPRVKARMIPHYGAQRLARATIKDMEELLDEMKLSAQMAPSDFLGLPAQYTNTQIEDALEGLYSRLSRYEGEAIVKRAIERQIEDAQQAAYAYIYYLKNPKPFVHSFHTGGF